MDFARYTAQLSRNTLNQRSQVSSSCSETQGYKGTVISLQGGGEVNSMVSLRPSFDQIYYRWPFFVVGGFSYLVTTTRWLSFVTQFVRYNFLICLTWIDMSMLSRRIRIANGTTDAQLLRLFEPSYNDKGNNMVTRKVAGNHVGFIFMFQNSEKWLFFALVFSLPPEAFMRHHAKPATFA